jgi:hypothetical protein
LGASSFGRRQISLFGGWRKKLSRDDHFSSPGNNEMVILGFFTTQPVKHLVF